MEKINWAEMTNSEIIREELNLKNTFERIKGEIMEKIKELDELNAEFLRGERELNDRGIAV